LVPDVASHRAKRTARLRCLIDPPRHDLATNADAPCRRHAMAENVVVTVLLDKFLASNDEQETNERKAATERMEALLTLLGASAGSSMSSPLRAYSEASGGLDAWVKGKEYAQVRADMDALMLETRWAKNAIASVLEALPERHAPPLKKTISLPTEKVALVASIHPGSSKRSPLAGSPLGAPTVV